MVTYGNTNCAVTALNTNTITCTIPTNVDNTLKIEAGSLTPIVHINPYGFLASASGLTAISENIVVTSVTPSSGGTNGGTTIVIKGGFYPL